MGLRIFNTRTGKVEPFESLEPGKVKMFVCGPTVQDFIHLGHARTYLFYDLLARYLSYLGNEVDFVINITDIDEAIVKGARRESSTIEEFTSKYEKGFIEDMGRLGIKIPSYDRVSRYVPEMISQVRGLLRKGHGYELGKSVYFSIDTFHEFGRLSGQTAQEISLRPLEIAEGKRNQADFSLWRDSGKDEQKWDSPWGKGTPGWHIEDTAVSHSHFGPQCDIHGGARELIYPHHEAQIAEMESLYGVRPSVKYWVHSGLLTISREKMAKSRGNAPRVREILRDYDANGLRMYLLGMHHRRDSEFDESELKTSEESFWDLRSLAARVEDKARRGAGSPALKDQFFAALDDDLHGKLAIRSLIRAAREGVEGSPRGAAYAHRLLKAGSSILGIDIFGKQG
jgi:cysteinyl-tRNA synthetase